MTRARAALVMDHPFFGALALRLRLIPDASRDTAATDGQVIRYNPSYVDSLSDAQLRGVIAHEVLHCAAGHCWRRGNRNPRAWNVACDRAINHHVLAAGLTLPEGVLPGEDAAAETIFAGMATDPGDMPGMGASGAGGQNGQDADPGRCGAVLDAPDDADGSGAGATENEWQVATVQAAMAARAMGKLPAIGERMLEAFTRPPVDWRTVLADFITRTARNDYDWSRPNARHAGRGIILPGLRSNELPEVIVAIDTSGSIGPEMLAAFGAAVSDILAAYPTTVHVLAIDADVQSSAEYRTADLPIHLDKLPGGGGTDFRPAFDWVDAQGITPACLIYLTDLYGSFPDDAPDYPVLWVCTSDERAPFGETLNVPETQ
jgi:predicted metal-dependent peptidase